MPEKLEINQSILDIRWLLNLAWAQDTQELALNNFLSEPRVRNTIRNLTDSGYDPVVIGSISTQACNFVRGEVF